MAVVTPSVCDNRKNIHLYLCPHDTVSPLAENLFSPQSQKDLLVSFGLSARTVFFPSLAGDATVQSLPCDWGGEPGGSGMGLRVARTRV